MRVALKPIAEQTIVITGASSGIGLATALAAAAKGARVVLAARGSEALDQAVQRIRDAGGESIGVPVDVGVEADLRRLARTAIDRYGGFDTWVNNAGVDIWGRLDEVDEADHRRLFETNFWGTVHGSLVALEHLKRHGGALINVGSVASDHPYPLQGMYSASKQAIRGFTDTLRMEVEQEGVPVSITLIKPAAVGTPLARHARNYFDREAQLPPPLYAPEEVAKAILHAASHPRRDVFVGGTAKAMSVLAARVPRLADLIGERVLAPRQLADRPATRHEDNLHHHSVGDASVHGDQAARLHTSLYTRLSLRPGVAAAALGAGAGAIAGIVLSRRRGGRPRRRR